MAEERQKDKVSDDRAETRSVAGHSFKRRGSVWIDVLYDSDRPTVNVSRGSDHYRSLVGDEPGLRTIAEQLSGEIIVVWKGRALPDSVNLAVLKLLANCRQVSENSQVGKSGLLALKSH